ncbi:hypothetical protein CesoFtcFv8_003468 [Champsocephalus esox]|uniref:CCHC-type domain-containing protein n=1 Tax=Champsocephalus esox TaxID=159716 RepID=A0AAN8HBX6_9TELE|nr:hypothetical protein CesoFtcFv8_003468 [Champsocephalus esox]
MDPTETERLKQAISTQGARVGQHEQALQSIMESLHNLNTGFTQLSGRLDQSFIQLNTLTASAPAPPPPAPEIPVIHPGQPREPFIPTPVRYSGDSGICSQFLHQCSIVFDQQPLTYSSDITRVAFVMSLLSGKAAASAVAIAKSNPAIYNSFLVFETEMYRVFDHPLQGKEAGNRLLSLRQGSESVSTYSIDFRILAAESGWDEMALQIVFSRGLNDQLKDELAARDETSSLEELISLAIRLDNRLRERRRERTDRQRFPLPFSQPKSPRPPGQSAPPNQRLEPFSYRDPPTVSSSLSPEEPMQLGRMRLSPAERERRFLQRLCIYCGQAGHIRANCSARPKEQAQQPGERRW